MERATEGEDLYPPIVLKDNVVIYEQEVINKVHQMYHDLQNSPLLSKTNARYYKLDIKPHHGPICSFTRYSDSITLSTQAIEECGLDTIRLMLLHNLSHAALPDHYHDIVWQSFIQSLGGDPRIRSCGFSNPIKFPYTLCCSDPACVDSQSELRKTIGADKQCNRCRKQKVYILT